MCLEAGLSDVACEHVPYINYVVPKYCASESFSIEYTCTIVGLVLLSILRTFVVDQAQIITNHCRSVRFTAVVSLDESPSRKRDSDLDSQCFDSDHFAVFFPAECFHWSVTHSHSTEMVFFFLRFHQISLIFTKHFISQINESTSNGHAKSVAKMPRSKGAPLFATLLSHICSS